MHESELTSREIQDAIAEQLQDDDHEHWAGVGRHDREELAVDVQAGRCTVAEAAEQVRAWNRDPRRGDDGPATLIVGA